MGWVEPKKNKCLGMGEGFANMAVNPNWTLLLYIDMENVHQNLKKGKMCSRLLQVTFVLVGLQHPSLCIGKIYFM